MFFVGGEYRSHPTFRYAQCGAYNKESSSTICRKVASLIHRYSLKGETPHNLRCKPWWIAPDGGDMW